MGTFRSEIRRTASLMFRDTSTGPQSLGHLCTVVRCSEYSPKERPDERFGALVPKMMTPEGVALITELIAAVWLMVGLAGLAMFRSRMWLACSITATAALIVAAIIIVDLST
jgi:hypothetical protein